MRQITETNAKYIEEALLEWLEERKGAAQKSLRVCNKVRLVRNALQQMRTYKVIKKTSNNERK